MTNKLSSAFALASVLGMSACGDDAPNNAIECPPTADAAPDGPPNPQPVWVQIEHLARPGINEALLLSNGFHAGYNATAPSFAGVDPATLNMVVDEAKTVLKAVYYGVCLLNGTLVPTPADGLKPAGAQCPAIGGNIFVGGQVTGTELTAAMKAAAQAYADRVFTQFESDVMRIDTSQDSGYVHNGTALTLCGDPTMSYQLLCGGRKLNEDVIDITYDYLFAGAAITLGGPPESDPTGKQLRSLVSDGVAFDKGGAGTLNAFNLLAPDPANPNQGHPAVSSTFPYSAAPF